MKHIIKTTITIIALLYTALSLTACSSTSYKGNQSTEPAVRTRCNWETVNSSLEEYAFGGKYFLPEDYKEDEDDSNNVSVFNYDPSNASSFKDVPYQVMLSYGQTEGYDEAMITVSMVDNSSSDSFTVISNAEGESVFEEGTWFLEEDKGTKVQELIDDAMTIFGLK